MKLRHEIESSAVAFILNASFRKMHTRIMESNGCDHRGVMVFHNSYLCIVVGLFQRQYSRHPLDIKGDIANEISATPLQHLSPR